MTAGSARDADGPTAPGGQAAPDRTTPPQAAPERVEPSTLQAQAAARMSLGTGMILLIALLATAVIGLRAPGAPLRAGEVALRLNPNTASRAELMLLPGIGPTLAENIVAYRTAYRDHSSRDAFSAPEDLDRVHRIGPVTVERMRDMLIFDTKAPAPDAGAPQLRPGTTRGGAPD